MGEATPRKWSPLSLLFDVSNHAFIFATQIMGAGLLLGHDSGIIHPALNHMMNKFPEIQKSKRLQGTIVSMGLLGAILGLELGRCVNGRFGRRRLATLSANLLIFCGGSLTIIAPDPWLIIVGRLFVGMGVAMASTTASLYVSEVLPSKIRPIMVIYGISFLYGQFSAYISYMISLEREGAVWSVHGQDVAFALSFMLFNLIILPESPTWLYKKGRKHEAFKILSHIYDGEEFEEYVQALGSTDTGYIFATLEEGSNIPKAKVFKQPLVGVEVLMYYTLPVLQFAGISRSVVQVMSLLVFGFTASSSYRSSGPEIM